MTSAPHVRIVGDGTYELWTSLGPSKAHVTCLTRKELQELASDVRRALKGEDAPETSECRYCGAFITRHHIS